MSDPDIMGLTRELCAIPTSVVDPSNVILFDRVAREVPLRIFKYPSGSQHNGWVVPQAWSVKTATIKRDGNTIYDGAQGRLGVAQNSRSFQGRVTSDELKKHLYTNGDLPTDARVWHCSWLYRPWQTDWGMTPERRVVNGLSDEEYDVDLRTDFSDGDMLVGDYHLAGEHSQTLVIQSHTCHPHMANDGFSAAAIAIRLMQWLQTRKNKYSYRLVLAPEHIGTIFYLASLPKEETNNIVGAVFAEMLGNDAPLVMGTSFWGNSYLDAIFNHVGNRYAEDFKKFPFRQTVGNDETVWDAAGIEIPMVQINRCAKFQYPFPEYHSTLDTPDSLDPQKLDEAFRFLQRAIEIFDSNATMVRHFEGLLCLSNPKHGLYRPRVDPSIQAGTQSLIEDRWGYFQDCVTRYMDANLSVLEISERHGLPYFEVLDYLRKWEAKGLISFNALQPRRDARMEIGQVVHSWEGLPRQSSSK